MQKKTLIKNGLRGVLPRIFASWITVLALFALRYPYDILTLERTDAIGLLPFLITVLLVFLILTLLSLFHRADPINKAVLILSSTLYASVVAYSSASVLTAAVAVCVLFLLFWYCLSGRKKPFRALPAPLCFGASVAAGIFFAVFVGTVTVLRYRCFASPNYDFGIFCNMFYHMKKEFLPIVSSERDKLLSHFAIHISPVYYLILPFYMLFPSPITLQIAQAVILASGVIPVYFLSKKLGFSGKTAFLFCFLYSLYPALSGGCMYDIHENCFLTPLLLFLFLFAEEKKTVPMLLFAFLTLTVKEDAAVYVAFFALFLLLAKRRTRDGVILLSMAVVWFFGATALLEHYGEGVMNYRYSNYFTGDGNMVTVLLNVIKNPSLVLKTVFTVERLEFILLMLLPLAFLPFFVKRKPARLLLVCPFLLVNLMPDYVYQYSIYFQYVFGSTSFLIYAAMLNVSDSKARQKRTLPALCAVASLVLFLSSTAQRGYLMTTYQTGKENFAKMEEALQTIPKGATVKASTFLIAHIADRDEVYVITSEHDTDYIAIDLYHTGENSAKRDAALQNDENYLCTVHLDGLLSIYQKKGS